MYKDMLNFIHLRGNANLDHNKLSIQITMAKMIKTDYFNYY